MQLSVLQKKETYHAIFFEKASKWAYTKEKEIQTIRILSSVSFSAVVLISAFLMSQRWGDTQRVPSWVSTVDTTGDTMGSQRGETQPLEDFDPTGEGPPGTPGTRRR